MLLKTDGKMFKTGEKVVVSIWNFRTNKREDIVGEFVSFGLNAMTGEPQIKVKDNGIERNVGLDFLEGLQSGEVEGIKDAPTAAEKSPQPAAEKRLTVVKNDENDSPTTAEISPESGDIPTPVGAA